MKRTLTRKVIITVGKVSKWVFWGLGVSLFVMLILSFTNIPFWGVYRLANSHSNYQFTPDYIVVMSGSGIPSPSALMRTYHASKAAETFPNATLIIACTEKRDSLGAIIDSTAILMAKEIRMRGTNNPILFEKEGTNTRSQAMGVAKILGSTNSKLVVLSSPEHIFRAASAFEKVGFENVGGWGSFEQEIQMALPFDTDTLGGKMYLPDVGNNEKVRYKFWGYWTLQIHLLREYMAIIYYKLQGWI